MANTAKAIEGREAAREAGPRQPGGGEYLVADATRDDVFTPEDFTEEQKAIGDSTEAFVRDEVRPRAEELEKQHFASTSRRPTAASNSTRRRACSRPRSSPPAARSR